MLTLSEIKNKLLSIDKEFAIKRIVCAVQQYFRQVNAKYAVMGLSGGVDSSTTLAILTRALDTDRIKCLIMPHSKITPKEDTNDAVKLASQYGIEPIIIEIDEIADSFKRKMENSGLDMNKLAYGNTLARIRMMILYSFANSLNGLVVGSGDKSELLLGYFTKYGDGGVDILPLGDLYKTQVRMLAEYLGVPKKIAYKPSSPRLWQGQTAVEELGADYDVIDAILYAFIELRKPLEEVFEIQGIQKSLIQSILRRVFLNEHKRRFPFIPKLSPGMTIGIDWRVPRISKLI